MKVNIYQGTAVEGLQRMSAQGLRARTCVTSPPYFGLRDYGHKEQIGLEASPVEYVASLVAVFRAVRDVLTDDGTLWLNIGDSYAANRTHQVASTRGGPKHREAQAAGGRGQRASDYGCKPKDLIGIPWLLAFALRADGWYLRQEIIWHKPNPMPESVTGRCTKAHESIFLFAKSERYFFDSEAMQEPCVSSEKDLARAKVTGRGEQEASAAYLGSPQRDKSGGFPTRGRAAGNKTHKYVTEYEGSDSEQHRTKAGLMAIAATVYDTRNRRSVWTVATRPYKGAHFATYPPELIEPCILAGSAREDFVLDPFMGSGTTAAVSVQHGRNVLGCELNPKYLPLIRQRVAEVDRFGTDVVFRRKFSA